MEKLACTFNILMAGASHKFSLQLKNQSGKPWSAAKQAQTCSFKQMLCRLATTIGSVICSAAKYPMP